MAPTTNHRRVLVTLPPPLDALVEQAAAAAGMTVPAYLTSLAAAKHKVKLAEPLKRGGKRIPKKTGE